MKNQKEFIDAKRPLDVKAVLANILVHWKSILLVIVLFFALGFGRNYLRGRNAEETASSGTPSSNAFFTEELSKADDHIQEKKDYMSSSIKGKIDDEHQGSAGALIYVNNPDSAGLSASLQSAASDTDSSGATASSRSEAGLADVKTDAIVESLKNYMNTGLDWEAISEEMGEAGGKYIEEIVSTGDNGSSLAVSVFYTSKEGAEKIRDYILDALTKQADQIIRNNSTFSACTYEVVNKTSSDTVEIPSNNWQSETIRGLKELSDTRSVLSDMQSNTSANASAAYSTKALVKSGIKYALLGFVLCVLVLLVHLLTAGKVLTARELNTCYGLDSLAVLPRKKTGLSQKILSIDPENDVTLSREDILKLTGASLKDNEAQSIALVGDLSEKELKAIADKLKTFSGKQVTAYPAVLNSLDERMAVNRSDAVILAAKRNKSKYRKLNAILAAVDQTVIGSIVE
jgi:hypothetical protein